jgi:hypothetical protein
MSGGETWGRNIGSKEGMVEGVEGISCALEGVVMPAQQECSCLKGG